MRDDRACSRCDVDRLGAVRAPARAALQAMHRLREALGLPEETCEEVAEGIIGMFRTSAVKRIEGMEYR